jgi:predicted chitinase
LKSLKINLKEKKAKIKFIVTKGSQTANDDTGNIDVKFMRGGKFIEKVTHNGIKYGDTFNVEIDNSKNIDQIEFYANDDDTFFDGGISNVFCGAVKIKSCYCNRDFTVEELTNIITELRKKENIHLEQQFHNHTDPLYKNKAGVSLIKKGSSGYYDLQGNFVQKDGAEAYKVSVNNFDIEGTKIFDYKLKEKIQETDCNLDTFTKEINEMFKKYQINTCIRKIHFLAQSYHESQRFHKSYESNPNNNVKGGEHYRGRGLLQLTHDYNYKKFYFDMYGKNATDKELFDFTPKVAKKMHLAIYSSGYYWKNIGSKYGNISQFADKDDVLTVSKEINGYVTIPNGYPERVKYTNELKKIMEYEKCITKK